MLITPISRNMVRAITGGGRSSARETAISRCRRSNCKEILEIRVWHRNLRICVATWSDKTQAVDKDLINTNPFFCADADQLEAMESSCGT